jgi:glyoxylate utilization-related uncharacterized protein
MLVLVLPVAGLAATFWKLGKTLVVGGWQRTEGRPVRRTALVLVTGAAAAGAAYIWLPNGDYRPIQPGERGTIQGGIAQFGSVHTGRPALTEKRERELGGAPLRSKETKAPAQQQEQQPASTSTTPTSSVTGESETTPTSTEPSATATTTSTTTTPAETTQTPTATSPSDTATTPSETTTTSP